MTDAHNDPGGVDDKPNEPTTEAGRRYLDSWDAQREVYTADADIRAIEQEARADERRIVTDALGSYMEAVDLLKERDELRDALSLLRKRDMLDGSPCWCVSDEWPHEGWMHGLICQKVRTALSKSEEQEGG